ncbi:MAG: PHP domain-containing protein [Porticoccaceae bacterium]
MGFIDLHLHSSCSDGILTPAQVVLAARDAGVTTIALCDHDTVAGVADALRAGTVAGVAVIPGVELSVAFHDYQDVHLLGYGINTTSPELLTQLGAFAARRANRNREIVGAVNSRLATQGQHPLLVGEVEALAGGVIGRPHIARALLARGYVATMQQAFEQYLVPCNVPKYYWPMDEALSTIRRLGGVAVLAHPTTITQDYQLLGDLISELQSIGLDGVEVYNALASEADMLFLQGLARRLNLLVTGGSDFHGTNPEERIGKGRGGIRFSDALLPPLMALTAQRAAITETSLP